MAKPPASAEDRARKSLAQEAQTRLEDARKQKQDVEADIREAYFLTVPRLSREILSTTTPTAPPRDADALATNLGSEVNEDFATEVINAFMPPHVSWGASAKGEGVTDQDWSAVKELAKANDDMVFTAIRASNFDAELARALIPDCGIGTVAMWVRDDAAHEPIRCLHIPLRELEINIGPHGDVDDRFIVRHVRARKVQALFPGKFLPAKVAKKAKDKPEEWCECVWGFWRDWSRPTDVIWQWVCMADKETVEHGTYQGDGSCPLIVGRFSPDSLHAWGNGPTIRSLPYLRIVDVLAECVQDSAPFAVRPPIAYPDDGVMDFKDGIRDGMAYPKRPGSKGEIEPLYPNTGAADLGIYTLADLEKSVRRMHFADYPEQSGDTPPTATQWIDEMVRSQRRIGTPGLSFWREFPREVFLRFQYLQMKRGRIQALSSERGAVATMPVNPATKAQENQEVQVATNLLSIAKSMFPMTSNAAIDELATIEHFKEKLGDRLVVLRPKEVVDAFIQQIIGQAQQAMGGGGEAPPQ